MLTDYERKVLRILFNYSSGRRRLPTIHELTVKTGKGEPDVMAALDALIAMKYIHWENKSDISTLVILEGWERDSEKPVIPKINSSSPAQSNDLRYWTDY
ncbi:hypothetical protein [Paenibacillus sp. FSL R5-0519]|uniref:hypothetical protein n=1 Tax=Paenibacillus sp. FSL R5-0519 TaxID=2921648 RepID=UPI0030D8ACF2